MLIKVTYAGIKTYICSYTASMCCMTMYILRVRVLENHSELFPIYYPSSYCSQTFLLFDLLSSSDSVSDSPLSCWMTSATYLWTDSPLTAFMRLLHMNNMYGNYSNLIADNVEQKHISLTTLLGQDKNSALHRIKISHFTDMPPPSRHVSHSSHYYCGIPWNSNA